MKIDFDQAVALLSPAPLPIVMTVDGKDYTLRRLAVGEVIILDTVGKGLGAGGDAIEFLQSLFVGNAPPMLEAFRQAVQQLDARRKLAAEKFPKLRELTDAQGQPRKITASDVWTECGRRAPDGLDDFIEVEQRYVDLNRKASLLQVAIAAAVEETTPKNAWPAAMANIDRQIQSSQTTGSPASPASTSGSAR